MVGDSYTSVAQQAILRQNITLSVIKKNADQERAVANVIEQSANTVQALNNRGTRVNFTA